MGSYIARVLHTNRAILQKIAAKTFLLAVVLVVLNSLYAFLLWDADVEEHSFFKTAVRNLPSETELLYIGESSNITFSPKDADKRSISAFLSDHFPNKPLYDITKPASHAGTYYSLLKHLPEDMDLGTVVVTLNLRSFNAQWIHSRLEPALQQDLQLLRPYPALLNRFLLALNTDNQVTQREESERVYKQWKEEDLHFPYDFPHANVVEWYQHLEAELRANDDWDNLENVELASHYIKAYAFHIDTLTNPRIKDFEAIAQLAKEQGWHLVFNLLAENVEKAEALLGEDLSYLMEQNRALLVDYFSRRGVEVVDNLNALPNEQFVEQDWTSEHYAEKGRKYIAKNLALNLRKKYPEDFVAVAYESLLPTHFFNDCEQGEVWTQMKTLSDEKSYSGSYASKTGKGEMFSLTFEYPFQKIPDSCRTLVKVSAQVFQNSTEHEAELKLEMLGAEIDYFNASIPVAEHTRTTGEWSLFETRFVLPEKVMKAEIIKVYVLNPSGEDLFIDDLAIDFVAE